MQLKTTIIFNLDYDIVERLKKLENRSSFLNNILKEYFEKEDLSGMTAEQLDREVEALEFEIAETKRIKEKMEEIRNGRK